MKKRNKILLPIIIALLIFILFFILYINPQNYKKQINVNTYNLKNNDVDNNMRIISFSDLNLGFDYKIEDLNLLVSKINDMEPDIVVFNGDLTTNSLSAKDTEIIIKELQSIKAVYGKFANLGEKDDKKIRKLLEKAQFEVISNNSREVYRDDNKINLVFIENKNYDKILSKLKDDQFNFIVLHNPALLKDLLKYKVDVILAGHTLGGEYNLPFYGSLYPENKELDWYRGNWQDNGTQVVISNGIGNKYNKFRFLAPSSIELFNIN